jgi:hypothetical protein
MVKTYYFICARDGASIGEVPVAVNDDPANPFFGVKNEDDALAALLNFLPSRLGPGQYVATFDRVEDGAPMPKPMCAIVWDPRTGNCVWQITPGFPPKELIAACQVISLDQSLAMRAAILQENAREVTNKIQVANGAQIPKVPPTPRRR